MDVKNIYYFNEERETNWLRGKRDGREERETEFFILFFGIVYIILTSM